MSLTAEEALRKAKQLMGPATSPKSTLQDRRDFYTHLITLPSYPDKECKTFFGTLVGKFFAEFEDLQDSAIDALLDLCEDEDEKMRIIGIKGLGPTGRADPRWVRGNTGVLLQLLASQPSELKFVRDALDILLSVSPADVFSVMADDCRTAEEDTGASRRNILEYLNYEFIQQRYDLLEKGKHPEVEEVFRTEFYSVLPLASASERRMLASWLLPLSTVSGVNSTPKTRAEFLRMLRELAPAQTFTTEMQGVLAMLRAFQEKLAKAGVTLDPRWPIAFVGGQAKGVITLALGTSYPAKRLLESLKECVAASKAIWEKEEMEEFEELGSEVLIPDFVKAVVRYLVEIIPDNRATDHFFKHGVLYEQFLNAVYELVTFGRDRRKELIPEADARAFADLVPVAEMTTLRVAQVPYLAKEVVSWGPIAKYFALLGNHATPIEKVVPSWDAPPPPPRAPIQTQHLSRASRGVPVAVPLTGSAYLGARPGMAAGVFPGSSATPPSSAPSYAPTGTPASAPSYAPTAPVVPTAPTASAVSSPAVGGSSAPSSRPARTGGASAMEVDRPITPPLPPSSASASRPNHGDAGANADVRMASPPRSEKPRSERDEKRRKEERRDKEKSNGHGHGHSSSGRDRERDRESSQSRDRDTRREAPQAVPAPKDVPPHLAGKRPLADRISSTAPSSASSSAADPLGHAPAPAGPSAGESAGERGLSIMGGGKRQRAREEEDGDMERIKKSSNGQGREWDTKRGEKESKEAAVASFLSRLGPQPSDDAAQALRNRLGPGIKGNAAAGGAGGADKASASPSPLDPPAPPAAPQTISILNRSKAVPSTPASTSAGKPTSVDDGRIASGGPKDDDGEGVVRKGRGFKKEEEKVETTFEVPQRTFGHYQNNYHQQQQQAMLQRNFQQGNPNAMRGGMNGRGGFNGRGGQPSFGGVWRQRY
ncbi:hypothetical protein IAT38_002108 [Cryptococcus sp. DSM 104549]